MAQVELPDQLFIAAQRRAADQGYASVDEFVSELLSEELIDSPDVQSLFTPERLAKIDAAIEQVNAGKKLTLAQLDDEMAKWKAQWIQSQPH